MGNNCPGPIEQVKGWSRQDKQCLVDSDSTHDFAHCMETKRKQMGERNQMGGRTYKGKHALRRSKKRHGTKRRLR
jgi:hypothetical protein